jgi:hypothetical protein
MSTRLILSLVAEDACGVAFAVGGLCALRQCRLLARVHVAVGSGCGNILLALLIQAAQSCVEEEALTEDHTPWSALCDASDENWQRYLIEPALRWCGKNWEYDIHRQQLRSFCSRPFSLPWAHALAYLWDQDMSWPQLITSWARARHLPVCCFAGALEDDAVSVSLTTDNQCPTADGLDTAFTLTENTDIHAYLASSLGLARSADALPPCAVQCRLAGTSTATTKCVMGGGNTDALGYSTARMYFIKERMGILPSGSAAACAMEEKKSYDGDPSHKLLLIDAFTESPAHLLHSEPWTQYQTRQTHQEILSASDTKHESLRAYARGIATMFIPSFAPFLDPDTGPLRLYHACTPHARPLVGAPERLLQCCMNWGYWRTWHTFDRDTFDVASALALAPFPASRDPYHLLHYLVPSFVTTPSPTPTLSHLQTN